MQYPRATIWKYSDQIFNTGKYSQYRQILGFANRTRFYSQYHKLPSATLGNCWQPYGNAPDTLGSPEYSKYLQFSPTYTKKQRKMETTDRLFESIYCIYSNKSRQIQIYRQLLLVTQIPSNAQVFHGIWVANIKDRIPSNSAKYYIETSR